MTFFEGHDNLVEDLIRGLADVEAERDQVVDQLKRVREGVGALYAGLDDLEARLRRVLKESIPPEWSSAESVLRPTIEELIEASSLGDPEAKAARARVSDEQVADVMRRYNEMRSDARQPGDPT